MTSAAHLSARSWMSLFRTVLEGFFEVVTHCTHTWLCLRLQARIEFAGEFYSREANFALRQHWWCCLWRRSSSRFFLAGSALWHLTNLDRRVSHPNSAGRSTMTHSNSARAASCCFVVRGHSRHLWPGFAKMTFRLLCHNLRKTTFYMFYFINQIVCLRNSSYSVYSR